MILTKNFFGIDGEPIEFEWNIFPGRTSLEILRKIQKDLQEQNIEPENFEDRIIFMSMFNDIDWTRRGNSEQCISNPEQGKNYAKKFTQGHWTFLGLVSEKKWYGESNHLLKENGQDTANMMVEQFEETGHPVFKGVSPLARGILRKKNNKETIHFNGASMNAEPLANQLSIYGAVARWCDDFPSNPGRDPEPPRVLGSLEPTPKEPLRIGGAQGVVWVKRSRQGPG